MPMHTIYYTLTEVTRQRIDIEAATLAEAIEQVETYEYDNSDAWQVDSFEYSVSDVSGERDTLA